jgi:hypothetical protein
MKIKIKFVFYTVSFIFCIISCNGISFSDDEKEHEMPDFAILYPKIVDSLNVKDLCDSSFWFINLFNCDAQYFPNNDTVKSTTLGFQPLLYSDLQIMHDTIEIYFNYQDKNGIITQSKIRDNRTLLNGIAFSLKSRQRIYGCSLSGHPLTLNGSQSRFDNPLQPETIDFIRKNREKIDDNFRIFAVLNGVL